MRPINGYVSRGQRLYHKPPVRGSWTRQSVIMAVSETAVCGHSTVKGAVNTATFTEFLQTLQLPCGAVLLMDNIRFHHSMQVRQLLADRKWTAMYTPCYTPDANPIENIFSVVKHRFRQLMCLQPQVGITSHIDTVLSELTTSIASRSSLFQRCFARSAGLMHRTADGCLPNCELHAT